MSFDCVPEWYSQYRDIYARRLRTNQLIQELEEKLHMEKIRNNSCMRSKIIRNQEEKRNKLIACSQNGISRNKSLTQVGAHPLLWNAKACSCNYCRFGYSSPRETTGLSLDFKVDTCRGSFPTPGRFHSSPRQSSHFYRLKKYDSQKRILLEKIAESNMNPTERSDMTDPKIIIRHPLFSNLDGLNSARSLSSERKSLHENSFREGDSKEVKMRTEEAAKLQVPPLSLSNAENLQNSNWKTDPRKKQSKKVSVRFSIPSGD